MFVYPCLHRFYAVCSYKHTVIPGKLHKICVGKKNPQTSRCLTLIIVSTPVNVVRV